MLRSFLLTIIVIFFGFPQFFYAADTDADTLYYLTKSGQDTTRFLAYLKLSAKYHKVDNDSALYYLNRAEDELYVINDKYTDEIREKSKADYYKQKGFIYQYTDEYDSAENLYNKALYVYNKYQLFPKKAEVLNNIGALYEQRGNSPKALEYYFQVLKLCDSVNLLKMKSKALVNIGVVYANEGKYEDALEHYKEAAKLKFEVGDRKGEALIYNNIGIVYYYLEDFDKVLENFKRSLNVYRELNDIEAQSRPFFNIAEVYYLQDRLKEALYYYKKSYEIDKRLGKRVSQAETLSTIGTVYANLGQMEDGIRVLNEAIRILKQTEALSTLSDAIYKLALFYEYSGNYKLALQNYQKHKHISDSLKSMKKAEQLSRLKLQYETEKKDQQIELLQRNNELMTKARDQEESSKWLMVLIILFGILVLVLVFVLVSFMSRLRKERRFKLEVQQSGSLSFIGERNGVLGVERTRRKNKKDKIEIFNSGYNEISRFINYLSWTVNRNLKHGGIHNSLYQFPVDQLIKNVEALSISRQIQSGSIVFEKEGISLNELKAKLETHFDLYPFAESPVQIKYDNQNNDDLIQSDPYRLFFILIAFGDFFLSNKYWDKTGAISFDYKEEEYLEIVFSELSAKFNLSSLLQDKEHTMGLDFRLFTAIRLVQLWEGKILNESGDSANSFKIELPVDNADSMTYSYQIDGIQTLNIECNVKIMLNQAEIKNISLFESLAKSYGKSVSLEMVKGYPKDQIESEQVGVSIFITGVPALTSTFNEFLQEFQKNSGELVGLLLIHKPGIEMDKIVKGEKIVSIPDNELEDRLLFDFERLVHTLCLKRT